LRHVCESIGFLKNGTRDREICRLRNILEQRLVTGFYSSRSIIYDPVSDYQLSGVQVRKLK